LQSAALAAAANAILITDCTGTILWVNPAFTVLTGFSAQEALGNTPRLLKSHKHDAAFYRAFWSTISSGNTWRGEFVNRRKDGSILHTEQTVTPLLSARDEITHFIGIMQDITEQKNAEEQIRDQARLLDLAQDAIIVRDLEDRVLYWNQGAERLYGWTAQAAVRRPIQEVVYHDLQAFDTAKRELVQNGEWSGELRQVTRDEREVVVHSRWNLVRDERGNAKSILVINTDVTATKKLETQFFHAQRLDSIGTLASGIAHDLNNVLAPIMMVAQMLRSTAADDETARMVDTIATSAKRGADIVRQVLTFARGAEGDKVSLQLGHLVKETVKLMRETFPKTIDIAARVPSDLWTVNGDATQLDQLLLNLCVNARDAMPGGGRLEITAENAVLDENFASMVPHAQTGPHVILRVRDTGTGIPKSIIDKIFDPFFTTKTVGEGTGLGLATVIGIVKGHGGFITVDSQVDRGATFSVHLPAVSDAPPQRDVGEEATLPRGNGELILVVDDEVGIRKVSRQVLERDGYRVLTAADGVEALAVFSDHRDEVKLVLSDVIMPNMDGVALTRVLRKMAPELPIVVSSGVCGGFEETDKGEELKTLKVSAFLPKPYTAHTLLTALHKLLDPAGSRARGSG
jgi:PAS domain S-box-containing protein